VPAGVVLVGVSDRSSYYYYNSSGEQRVFAGLLRRRSSEDRTIPVEPHFSGQGSKRSRANGLNGVSGHKGSQPAAVATATEEKPAFSNGVRKVTSKQPRAAAANPANTPHGTPAEPEGGSENGTPAEPEGGSDNGAT
jgi:hypothetical protein